MNEAGRSDRRGRRSALLSIVLSIATYLILTLIFYPVIAYGTRGAINVSPYRYLFVASFLALVASVIIRAVVTSEVLNHLILVSLLATSLMAFIDEYEAITSRHLSFKVLPFVLILKHGSKEVISIDLGQLLLAIAIILTLITYLRSRGNTIPSKG